MFAQHVCPWDQCSDGCPFWVGAMLGAAQDVEAGRQGNLQVLRLFWVIIMPFVEPWEFMAWEPITCAALISSGQQGQGR